MFTEGLDESAIKWIKQGSEMEVQEQQQQTPQAIRSPLAEKLTSDAYPISPLRFGTNSGGGGPALPPLKFHSGLLAPHSLVAPCLSSDDENDYDDDNESVDSVSDMGSSANYFEEESKPTEQYYQEEEEEVFGYRDKPSTGLNRGLLKEGLRVELPGNCRRFTDGEVGFKKRCPPKTSTPGACNQLLKTAQLRNFNGTAPRGDECGVLRDSADLGTPSAPPIFEIGRDEAGIDDEIQGGQEVSEGVRESNAAENSTCPSRGSMRFDGSVEGLADLDTSSFKASELGERINKSIAGETETKASQLDHSYYNTRLNTFLLQARGAQPLEAKSSRNAEQTFAPKAKKVVGKIRVEVKKLRVIPRRKLKSTYSQRSAMYIQAGAEYVRHVSSLVKTGINSFKSSSFSVIPQEPLSCILKLSSATEDTEVEPSSATCLHPGSGDYHVFFPESQVDALLVEIHDTKKSVQGRTIIPISSLNDSTSDKLRWWPLYHDDQECIGKIQLNIGGMITSDEANHIKSGPVAETLAYDLLLEAAMRAQNFHSRNLWLHGTWKWLLTEFAEYYEVSQSYTKLRYLLHVMNVATPTKDCLELVNELLVPIIKARSQKCLTRQEKSVLLECENQIESLLANVFENYKSLDEGSPTGFTSSFGPTPDSAAPALAPSVQVYMILHDILTLDAQTMLRNYLETAAKKRYRRHALDTDEFVSSNSEGFLMDSISISTAYLKMKNLCINIQKEIQADIKIHNQHVLPSSIDLSNLAAAIYSTELYNRLQAFLAALPPSGPQLHVNELLIAVAEFERNLESWNISPVQGGVDSKHLFHDYIMVWVQDMQLNLNVAGQKRCHGLVCQQIVPPHHLLRICMRISERPLFNTRWYSIDGLNTP